MMPLGVLASSRVGATGGLTSVILSDAPVSFWPLDGTPEDVVTSQSMNVEPGVSWAASAEYGTVMDGTNGSLWRSTEPRLNRTQYSYEIIARRTGPHKKESVPFADWGGVAQGSMLYFSDGGSHRVYHRSAYLNIPVTTFDVTGEWAHLAVTWDGSTQSTFKNGVQVASVARTEDPQNGSPWLLISGYARVTGDTKAVPASLWPGHLSHAALYNYALPPARILAHAQAAGVA